MKIVRLTAENVKKIKAVEIIPKGNTVLISGRNNQGKTSVLDSIWLALGGGDAAKGNRMPIRRGESRASVTVDLGDIQVTRTWTADDRSYLQVATKDGATYKAPQAILDKLIGDLSFDPLAFTRQPEKEQARTLMGMVELSIDPEKIDTKIKAVYDGRTITTRALKQLEAQLAAMPAPAPDLPAEEIKLGDLLAELRRATETQNGIDALHREAKSFEDKSSVKSLACEALKREIEELSEELELMKGRLKASETEAKQLQEKAQTLLREYEAAEPPDIDGIQRRIQEAEVTNRTVRGVAFYRNLQGKVADTKAEVDQATKEIDALQQQKVDAIRAAKYPIEGLGFDENGVTFQGIPLSQCAASEQLKVSMAIAMSLNPKLRVIRILDGSLLDEDNLRVIQEMAQENDFQIWCEVVDSTGQVGIVIEDGTVAAVNDEAVA